MARIIVTPDDHDTVLLDERHVSDVHLTDEHAATQLLDRLEWAVKDANVHERMAEIMSYTDGPFD